MPEGIGTKPRRLCGHGCAPSGEFVGVVGVGAVDERQAGRVARVVLGEPAIEDIEENADAFVFACEELSTAVVELLERRRVPYVAGCPDVELWDQGDIVHIDSRGQSVTLLHDGESREALIMVNSRCNSNCVMCPDSEALRQRDSALDTDELVSMVDLLPPDLAHLTVTGGEPTLVPVRLFAVLRRKVERFPGVRCLVLTNGRMCCYSDFVAELAASAGPETLLSIPIHAAEPNRHDAITQSKGSLEETIEGIRNLLEAGVPTEVRVVVSRLNLDEISHVAGLVESELKGIQRVVFMTLEMTGCAAKNRSDVWVGYDELVPQVVHAASQVLAARIPVAFYNLPLCYLPEDFRPFAQQSISSHKVTYADDCRECSVIDTCSGFFSSTLRLMKPQVSPVLEA